MSRALVDGRKRRKRVVTRRIATPVLMVKMIGAAKV
jgi:hypothetical protein